MGFETKGAGAAIRPTAIDARPNRTDPYPGSSGSCPRRSVPLSRASPYMGPHMRARCIRGPSFRRTTSLASPVSAKFAAMAAERSGKSSTTKR